MDDQNNRNSAPSNRGEMFDGALDAFRRDVERPVSALDMFSEMRDRVAAVETSQASIHQKIDDATKAGSLDPELLERVAHVMMKYFPHDMAEKEPVAPPRPKFDAFTGQPLQ